MARKLSDKKREELFQAWCERQSVTFVRKKCRVHNTTVKRYKKIDQWDKRLEEVNRETQRNLHQTMGQRRAQDIELARNMRLGIYNEVAQRIRNRRLEDVKFSELVTAYVQLHKDELLLEGEATERTDTAGSDDSQRIRDAIEPVLSELTPDQQKRLADRIADDFELSEQE